MKFVVSESLKPPVAKLKVLPIFKMSWFHTGPLENIYKEANVLLQEHSLRVPAVIQWMPVFFSYRERQHQARSEWLCFKKLYFPFLMNVINHRNLQYPSHNYTRARVKRKNVRVNFLTSKFNPPTSSLFSFTNTPLRTHSNNGRYVVLFHIDNILLVQHFASPRIR